MQPERREKEENEGNKCGGEMAIIYSIF